jgi:hypothetical protein
MGVAKHPLIDSGPTARRVDSFTGGCLIGIDLTPCIAANDDLKI